MDKFNVCIIDDMIPTSNYSDRIFVDDTSVLDKNILSNYLKWNEEIPWDDENLFDLIHRMMAQKDLISNIYGFKTHSFYLNYINENLFSPDIIIFDWDVGTTEKSEESLNEILKKTYCIIAIYTGCDKKDEINELINGEYFISFKSRMFLIEKGENSAEKVIEELKNRLNYFSFGYGRDFKYNINSAINTTFSTIGELSFEQFIKVFGLFNENKFQISSVDFIEIMNEQIKAHLLSSGSIETLTATEQTADNDKIERQLWHFRMFHKPQDDFVRKGDIVINKEDNKYYLIISSDCHLTDFWKKNVGFLVTVPLYEAKKEITKKLMKIFKEKKLRSYRLTSLVNPQEISVTVFPFIEKDYIVMLKEIKTFEINTPDGYDKNKKEKYPLKYDNMANFDGVNRFRLNEQFLNPLIERILRSITDIGVPDYSKNIKSYLEKNITELGNESKEEK